jgi:hypothetical protein
MASVFNSHAEALESGLAVGRNHIYTVTGADGKKLYCIASTPKAAVAECAHHFGLHAFLTTRLPATSEELSQARRLVSQAKRELSEDDIEKLKAFANGRVTSEPDKVPDKH